MMSHIGMLGAFGETLALLGIGLLWTYRVQAVIWMRELLDISGAARSPGATRICLIPSTGERSHDGRREPSRCSALWRCCLLGRSSF